MRLPPFLFFLVISLGSLSFGCEQVTDPVKKLTATKIKDILDHSRNYENKEVTIYGTVTDAVSLLVVKYFEIRDDTGTIKVVTDKLLPTKGEKLKVTGRMTAIEIGTERWIVLREKGDTEVRRERRE
jgi:aspartyl/asparaginyl-tRNA synthetase